jgi:hypothetical protein
METRLSDVRNALFNKLNSKVLYSRNSQLVDGKYAAIGVINNKQQARQPSNFNIIKSTNSEPEPSLLNHL